jgi:hypothetical protein
MGAHTWTAILLFAIGICLVVTGLAWLRNVRGMTEGFYGAVVRWWRRVPVVGSMYERIVPPRHFAVTASASFMLMGGILVVIGVLLLPKA